MSRRAFLHSTDSSLSRCHRKQYEGWWEGMEWVEKNGVAREPIETVYRKRRTGQLVLGAQLPPPPLFFTPTVNSPSKKSGKCPPELKKKKLCADVQNERTTNLAFQARKWRIVFFAIRIHCLLKNKVKY